MAYSLDAFCEETREILKQPHSPETLAAIAANLERLLADEAFVEETFGAANLPRRRILHHDEETDFYFLALIHPPGRRSPPHDHGESWAVYGTAKGCTNMCEWRRTEMPEGGFRLEPVERYALTPGRVRAYGPGTIHSTSFDDTGWVIRVTGTDLLTIPVFRYDKNRDIIMEEGATV